MSFASDSGAGVRLPSENPLFCLLWPQYGGDQGAGKGELLAHRMVALSNG